VVVEHFGDSIAELVDASDQRLRRFA